MEALGWALAALLVAAHVHHRRRARDRLARACHEVRGPLTAARLALASAERRGAAPLRVVDRELARAGELLADVQGLGEDADEPVELSRVLRRTAEAWRPAARLIGRDVLVAAPGVGLRTRGDGGRLQQALSNLVHNALEHGEGLVVVGAREADAGVRVEVVDGGAGLPGGLPPQGSGPRGRGLAIAADIAARHGGRLETVRDECGHRMAMVLPRLEEPVLERSATANARVQLS